MRFEKRSLSPLPCCYAAAAIPVGGRNRYLFATDDRGPCLAVDPLDGSVETVWEGPGGAMSLIPLPGRDGEFLASQNFLPGFAALDARIVRVAYTEEGWQVAPWLDLPYVHRFDLLRQGGDTWLIACILSGTDQPTADWSSPGYVAAARLDGQFSPPAKLETVATGMTRNHGYCRAERDGLQQALIACHQGVFRLTPPQSGSRWTVEHLLDRAASDVAVCDIDGDGIDELALIEPFHGDQFVLYHQDGGSYREMYRYPSPLRFVHAIWGGQLLGEPVFLGGSRELDRELFALRWQDGRMVPQIIEAGCGPSNVAVVTENGRCHLLVANREAGECALFDVQPGAPGEL